uniref:retinal dehydrogenase 2-like n=1 Tax=Styela clava TaxID=7725 RepID=UPI0019395BF7|nr:retinal dehydrogenase 2-like [Styela clava]
MSTSVIEQKAVESVADPLQESSNSQCGGKDPAAACVPWPIPPPNPSPEVKYTKLFINNEWVDSEGGKTFPTKCPSTEKITADVSLASDADVDKAVQAAKRAFAAASWRRMDASDRGALMNKLADKIDENKYYLACLESMDSGKPYTHTFFMDTLGISKIIRYYAGWTDKIHGKTLPMDGEYLSYTKVLPLGVCGLIVPWNMPLISLAMKLGPALCCGNTVVVKPSEYTPLSTLFVASLAQEAGFPAGVINVVPGAGKTGAAIAAHKDVNKVSFTGSVKVGRLIEEAATKSNLKKVSLELSGNNPNIILPDADVDVAVEQAHQAVFMNQGQMCTAGSRTFVHEDIYEEFVAKSVARASRRVVTSPFELFCEQGPQISQDHFDRILNLIQTGIKEGAKLECGGYRHGEKGLYIQPTVFSDVKDHMTIAKEEIFGPVQCIFKFSTLNEVIQRANDTPYGLVAGVFTNDITTAFEVANELENGTVWINCFNAFAAQTPFGGCKISGKGKEMGKAAINEYSDTKTVTVKVPQLVKARPVAREYSSTSLHNDELSCQEPNAVNGI